MKKRPPSSFRLDKEDRRMLSVLRRRFRLKTRSDAIRVAIKSCFAALENERAGGK